jgi:hypothetical protein
MFTSTHSHSHSHPPVHSQYTYIDPPSPKSQPVGESELGLEIELLGKGKGNSQVSVCPLSTPHYKAVTQRISLRTFSSRLLLGTHHPNPHLPSFAKLRPTSLA